METREHFQQLTEKLIKIYVRSCMGKENKKTPKVLESLLDPLKSN